MTDKTAEQILIGIADEIRESDEWKRMLVEIGPEQMMRNAVEGLARLRARREAQVG